jgi:2-polyprenyl-3-methyl-5-hydroxy-6-metoxy-1,4-benzoquinol methylase
VANSIVSKFTDPAQTWNNRLQQDGFLLGTSPNEWLCLNASSLPASSHILCVADGEGRNSEWLAGLGHLVDAFDIAEVGVAKARKLAEKNGVMVNYRVDDCDSFRQRALSFKSFDVTLRGAGAHRVIPRGGEEASA